MRRCTASPKTRPTAGREARNPECCEDLRQCALLSLQARFAWLEVTACSAGHTEELFGWVVGSRTALRRPRAMPSATRMLRSLYELAADDAQSLPEDSSWTASASVQSTAVMLHNLDRGRP